MKNIPTVKLGIVAVSRDCFPMTLSEGRRSAIVKEYSKTGEIYECPVCIENEKDMPTINLKNPKIKYYDFTHDENEGRWTNYWCRKV